MRLQVDVAQLDGGIRIALIAPRDEWANSIVPSFEVAAELSNEVAEMHTILADVLEDEIHFIELPDYRDYELPPVDIAVLGVCTNQWIDGTEVQMACEAPLYYWKQVYGCVFNPNLITLIAHAFKQTIPDLMQTVKQCILRLPEPTVPVRTKR